MKVPIERYVEEVQRGVAYRGYIKIAGAKYNYWLTFGVPIYRLGALGHDTDPRKIRRTYRLKVKRGNFDVALSAKKLGFFLFMLGKCVLDFWLEYSKKPVAIPRTELPPPIDITDEELAMLGFPKFSPA